MLAAVLAAQLLTLICWHRVRYHFINRLTLMYKHAWQFPISPADARI